MGKMVTPVSNESRNRAIAGLTFEERQLTDLLTKLRNPDMKAGIGEAWELMDQAADEIERLRTEAFTLAAGVCEYRGGNEHGNPLCLKTNQLI